MMFAKWAIFCLVTANLLLSGLLGDGQVWLCRDPDGTVSFENASSRAVCCTRHHEHNSDEKSSCDGEPCCHDVLIASGHDSAPAQSVPSTVPPLVAIAFFEILRPFEVVPTMPVIARHQTPLARGSPPLAHLATVIILV